MPTIAQQTCILCILHVKKINGYEMVSMRVRFCPKIWEKTRLSKPHYIIAHPCSRFNIGGASVGGCTLIVQSVYSYWMLHLCAHSWLCVLTEIALGDDVGDHAPRPELCFGGSPGPPAPTVSIDKTWGNKGKVCKSCTSYAIIRVITVLRNLLYNHYYY